MGWYSAGVSQNPLGNAILADTGAQEVETSGDVCLVMSTTIPGIVVLEHRNAANDANIHSHAFTLGANSNESVDIKISVQPGERIRVRLNTGVLGFMQVSMFSNII